MKEVIPESLILKEDTSQAEIYYQKETATGLVLTKANFIPLEDFKEMFLKVSALAEKHPLKRIIFDKRSLTIFHQPSMEWYYKDWKIGVLKQFGITEHIKILPKDDLFRSSVDKARKKLLYPAENPELLRLKILYFENIKEALESFSKRKLA